MVLIPISPSDKNALEDNFFHKGMGLIEILVALTIAALLFYVSVSVPGPSDRNDLEQAMDTIEKIINFSINESILRNRITRTHFNLTEEIPQIMVEFNSDHEFVLPDVKKYDGKSLGILEREAKARLVNKINSKFKQIEELDTGQLKIPSTVRILGIATSSRPSFITDEETALYVYPTGEQDRALIIFASFEQVSALMTEPYTGEVKREYATITTENDLEKEYEKVVEKIFNNWSR